MFAHFASFVAGEEFFNKQEIEEGLSLIDIGQYLKVNESPKSIIEEVVEYK